MSCLSSRRNSGVPENARVTPGTDAKAGPALRPVCRVRGTGGMSQPLHRNRISSACVRQISVKGRCDQAQKWAAALTDKDTIAHRSGYAHPKQTVAAPEILVQTFPAHDRIRRPAHPRRKKDDTSILQ